MTDINSALNGFDLPVQLSSIEKSLADLWRVEGEGDEDAVVRAALWSVVAHTDNEEAKTFASATLSEASVHVPQRSIIVRATPHEEPHIESWISANCHLVGGGKQVCSEEISIVAGGSRIHHVPSLVQALLLPDLPVAAWWLGDLPNEQEEYVISLLDPVDRIVIDSLYFDSLEDIRLLVRLGTESHSTPADLNWARLEVWRKAAASLFDPPHMRARIRSVRSLRLVSAVSDETRFGETASALLFVSWISSQLGWKVDREGIVYSSEGKIDVRIERTHQQDDAGRIVFLSIGFEDGSAATIEKRRDIGVLRADVEGITESSTITRIMPVQPSDLVVRQLARRDNDAVFTRTLDAASRIGKQVR